MAIEKAQEPKKLFWIDGATHIDLYDKDEYVPTVVDKLDSYFTEYLVGNN
ncbi:alpha/beta hydrolase [Nocardia sp. NPDC050718]